MGLGRVGAVVVAVVAACVVAALVAAGDCGTGGGRTQGGDGADIASGGGDASKPDGAGDRRRSRSATADGRSQGGEIAPLRGTVVDADTHLPIAGASVTLWSVEAEREQGGSGVSGADGVFAVTRTTAGDVGVLVRAEGYAPEYFAVDGSVECDVQLARAKPVEVLVLDADVGTPIEGAEVQVHAYCTPASLPLTSVRTDASGRATILCGPAVPIYGFAPGYFPAGARYNRPDVTIRLQPADEVSGIVVDERGEPRARDVTVATQSTPPVRATIDEAGRFRLHPLGRGGHTLLATAKDLGDDVAVHATTGTTDLRIVVPRGGIVRGIVRFPDGAPVEEARVAGLLTGADGRFETNKLPAGRRTLKATVAPYEIPEAQAAGSMSVREYGMAGEVVVDVPPGGVVEDVEIRVAPLPVRYGIVRVVDAEGRTVATSPDQNEETVSRADGATAVVRLDGESFTKVSVSDRSRTLFSRIDAYVPTSETSDAEPTVVRLAPRVRLDVVVVGEPAGTPPTLGQPQLSNGRGDYLEPIERAGRTTSFLVDPASPVLVTLGRFNACAIFRRLTPEEIASGRIEIRDEGKATVTIVVRRAEGSVTNFGVYLAVGMPPSSKEHMFQLDEGGRGTLLRVPAGPARLVTRVGSVVLGERPVSVPETGELDLGVVEAPMPEVVRGTVRFPDGRPAGGANVTAIVRQGQRDWDSVGDTTSAADGTFRIAIPPGADAQFVATRPGFGPAAARRTGKDAALDLRLGAECIVRVRWTPRIAHFREDGLRVDWPDRTGFPFDDRELPAGPGKRLRELRGLPAANLVLYLGRGASERRLEVTPVPGRVTEVAFPAEK